MMRAGSPQSPQADMKTGVKKRSRSPFVKRAHSSSPSTARRAKSPVPVKKSMLERRCQSLSPSAQESNKSLQQMGARASVPATSYAMPLPIQDAFFNTTSTTESEHSTDKDPTLPQSVVTKMLRTLATKKREFLKLRRILIQQQNSLLENYAALKDLEFRAGVNLEDSLGEIKVLSVTSWPAHDLLLLLRDDLHVPTKSEIGGHLGLQILQQLNAHLDPIPEEVLSMGAELMARRIDLLNLLRSRLKSERGAYNSNLEWKTKNTELDNETEKLHRMVAGTAENLKDKINFCLDLARVPWIDREAMVKKIERLQKENMLLQNKIDEFNKRDEERKEGDWAQNSPAYQTVIEELCKERAAREALKEVVSTAEGMLRVARARIATLERQLKETRSELDAARRKHKDLEQLYRHRESSYDARSKKLIEVSKTGEITIEALSRQRDALELRVKELHEQAETAERTAEKREAELHDHAEALQVKVTEQEKNRIAAENRAIKLEMRVEELEEQLRSIRERSVKLVDMERRRCLEFVPTKENEPTDKETEIWKELQFTKASLSRAEEELRQSRTDKDNFLNSLSKIAQGEGSDNFRDKMSVELLDREQKIYKLQRIIEEQRENDRLMEQTMTQYENQLAALRLEVMRLRNYDCYYKEVPHQELQTELLETHMQVETLTRERAALVTAAASRALMLERHERSAELFARTTRARRELAALLESRQEPPLMEEVVHAEVSRSLSSMCATAADTWSALRAERARVIRLESAVLAQSLQLEREGRVRTQLERRRAILEREVLRAQHSTSSEHSAINKHPNTKHFLG